MIQTKIPITYGDRSERTGIILIEVRQVSVEPTGNKYLVIDWDITNKNTDAVFSKEVFWTTQEVDTMDAYLINNSDFSGMERTEIEHKKLQLALFIDTTSNLLTSGNTIYGQNPNIWELTL
jgi:hypothetical protein